MVWLQAREASTWREHIAKPEFGVRHVVFESALHGLVGIASAGPDRLAADWSDDQSGDNRTFNAELYGLYVLPGHQKQGIGQALYTRLADDLRYLGARSLRVWVLTVNHAGRAFYSVLGGEEQHTETFRLAGQTLHKTAYVWPDISVRRR